MLIEDMHHWLGNASGGAGPVFRWIWASMIIVCGIGFSYLVILAIR